MRTHSIAPRRALSALVLGLALGLALAHCSLLAPSDADLMKGNLSADASDDADDAASDASDDADGADGARDAACIPLGFFCNGQPQRCCSGTCNSAAGKKCD